MRCPRVTALALAFSLSAACPAWPSGVAEICNPSGMQEDGTFVDTPLRAIMEAQGRTDTPLLGRFPETDVERIELRGDPDGDVYELFLKRGWTDGLPIVAPTRERVMAMLRGTDRDRTEDVATLPPMNGIATVEKIAVNAVMAGCRPEHLPILIAAVEAVADPDFDLRGLATTTSPDVPCIILTGPLARRIGLETGFGSMGRGNPGNNAIGRALDLVIHNVGGSRPGLTDMSCLGSPMEHGMLIVENPDGNGPSLNADLGLPPDADAVTVMGAEGIRGVVAHGWDAAGIMKLMGEHLRGLAWQRPRWPVILLVIPGDTSYQLSHEGYDRERIRRELLRRNPIPREEYARWFANDFWGEGVRRTLAEHPGDPVVYGPVVDQFLIVYAGGQGMKNMIIPGWFGAKRAVTREIRLPTDRDRPAS